jgi:hypothetical protein
LFTREADEEAVWYQGRGRADGDGQEPWIPTPDPDAELFRGKVEGRFARPRALHGDFLDPAAFPDERLRKAGITARQHITDEERISRGLHPSEASTEPPWVRPSAQPGRATFPGDELEAVRSIPAEPDAMLEAVREAVRGPSLGIDFTPKTLAGDISGIVVEGKTLKFGGVGPDGKRLIPEGIDLMEVLRTVDPSQYEAQLNKKMEDILGRLAKDAKVDLDTLPSGVGVAEAMGVNMDALKGRALKELNEADFLEVKLQRATEQVVEGAIRGPDGALVDVTLSEAAAQRGWTNPVNRFGWTERQQMDYYVHKLGLLEADKSLYLQALQKREDIYIRALGQDVHMRTFERALANEGLIFGSDRFHALENAYKVFADRMDKWMGYLQEVGPLPKGMTVDDFVRRITGEAGPPRPGARGGGYLGREGYGPPDPISLNKFIESLPPRWKEVARIYRDASQQSAVDDIKKITNKLNDLELVTTKMRQQFDEASDAAAGAMEDLRRIQGEIGFATGTMMGTLRAVHPAATLDDLFTAALREAAPKIARHIPDLDGTLIREWDVARWAELTSRASSVLQYLRKVREALAEQVERRSTGEYVVGDKLTSAGEAAVRTQREVALANARADVAEEMGVAIDSPIPEGERTWRRLMAFISRSEGRLTTRDQGKRGATIQSRVSGAIEQFTEIDGFTGQPVLTGKRFIELAPDEAGVFIPGAGLSKEASALPTDEFTYRRGGWEFWRPVDGGDIAVLRRGEGYERGYHKHGTHIRVSEPPDAEARIRAEFRYEGALETTDMQRVRGDDIPRNQRHMIKIENLHSRPTRVSPREARPAGQPSDGTSVLGPYATTEIVDQGAGVVRLRRGYYGPDEDWDAVYRAVVGLGTSLDEAAGNPALGERVLQDFYDRRFPATYPGGRPPRAAGPHRNYVWVDRDELLALKAMERAATLRRIHLTTHAGRALVEKDVEFLTKTMGYGSVEEALRNIDDDVLVLAELALNPYTKRAATGAEEVVATRAGGPRAQLQETSTARLVPGETSEQVTELIERARSRTARVAADHGMDTSKGRSVAFAETERLFDRAIADTLALGKRRRRVRAVVKEVDAEATGRVAADPSVPPEIAAVPWTERDLSVLESVFTALHKKMEEPVANLQQDLIPLMKRLQEQKMATDETVQAAESLFEILTVAGPTGSYVKGAQKQWKAPTVLRKYEQIVDEVKRLEDFLGVRISGEGVSGGHVRGSVKQSSGRTPNPFRRLGAPALFLDDALAKAHSMVPKGAEGTFTRTLQSVTNSLSNAMEGMGAGLRAELLAKPELRAKWVALAKADAEVVTLIKEQADARIALVRASAAREKAATKLGAIPGQRAVQEERLAERAATTEAFVETTQGRLDTALDRIQGLAPDTAGAEREPIRGLFVEGTEEFGGVLQGGGMLGANAPKVLVDGLSPIEAVESILKGSARAEVELAEIAYYIGLNERLLEILPEEMADGVRRRLLADVAADPRLDETAQQSVLDHGWLGAEARKEYMKGDKEGMSWMHNVGNVSAAGEFNPGRIPAEGYQTLLREGAAGWGASLIAMAPNQGVAGEWASTVTDVLMAAQKITDREQVGQFLRRYDKLHNWLKAQLVATPGFVMRNMLGGATNMWFKDISPLEIIRTGKMMQQAYRAGEGDLIAGVRMMSQKNVDSLAWMRMRELVDSGAHAGGQAASAVDVGIIGRSRGDFFVGQRTIDKPGARVVYSPLSAEFTPWAAVRHANTFAEEAMRLATGMHAMKVWGDSVEEAMYTIHKLHFDYGKLSDFERKGMRRAFPFYTWTRNNLPLQAEFMARHPAKYNRLFSLKREMERNTPEEGTVPHYFLEPFGVRLPFQIMGAQIYSVPDTPFQDLLRYDPSYGGIGSTIEQIVSQTTPITKVPVEYWAGKQVFAGIPFTERYQQVPAIMKGVPGVDARATADWLGGAQQQPLRGGRVRGVGFTIQGWRAARLVSLLFRRLRGIICPRGGMGLRTTGLWMKRGRSLRDEDGKHVAVPPRGGTPSPSPSAIRGGGISNLAALFLSRSRR